MEKKVKRNGWHLFACGYLSIFEYFSPNDSRTLLRISKCIQLPTSRETKLRFQYEFFYSARLPSAGHIHFILFLFQLDILYVRVVYCSAQSKMKTLTQNNHAYTDTPENTNTHSQSHSHANEYHKPPLLKNKNVWNMIFQREKKAEPSETAEMKIYRNNTHHSLKHTFTVVIDNTPTFHLIFCFGLFHFADSIW